MEVCRRNLSLAADRRGHGVYGDGVLLIAGSIEYYLSACVSIRVIITGFVMLDNSFSVFLCPGNTHFAQVGNFFSELSVEKVENIKRALALERGGDVERLLAVLAVADGSVVRHDNSLAVHIGGDCGGDALFELLRAGQTVRAEHDSGAYNLASLLGQRGNSLRCCADYGRKLLMGVNDEARVGMSLVDLGVNALFGGGLDAALVAQSVDFYLNNVVGGQSVVGLSARGDDEAVFVNAAADVAPGSCDKTGLDKAQTRCDNFFFCL